ncbi:MAG: hypothetical protein IK088_01710 [Lachnospiraceae bacterium]|nr:hypothetical protein [Lachnospiraceae bacterium]
MQKDDLFLRTLITDHDRISVVSRRFLEAVCEDMAGGDNNDGWSFLSAFVEASTGLSEKKIRCFRMDRLLKEVRDYDCDNPGLDGIFPSERNLYIQLIKCFLQFLSESSGKDFRAEAFLAVSFPSFISEYREFLCSQCLPDPEEIISGIRRLVDLPDEFSIGDAVDALLKVFRSSWKLRCPIESYVAAFYDTARTADLIFLRCLYSLSLSKEVTHE